MGFIHYDKKTIVTDALFFVIGSFFYALSVNIFTTPQNIAPGGITGIAIILNHLFSLPTGIMIFVLNIPLFVLCIKQFGYNFLIKTLVATLLVSIMIDLTAPLLPPYSGDGLLSALFGGVLSGLGLSLIFLRGGTTGGTDIASRIIKKYYPSASIGSIIFFLDFAVIIFSAFAFSSINSALYAVVVIFCSTTMIDKILYGSHAGKVMYIFSSKIVEIEDYIIEDVARGATIFNAVGGYTKKPRKMLMCVLRRHEVQRVKKAVLTYDQDAFIVIGEAVEIFGLGFNQD